MAYQRKKISEKEEEIVSSTEETTLAEEKDTSSMEEVLKPETLPKPPRQPFKSGRVFLSEEEIRSLKGFTKQISNKLGLGGSSRSFKV